MTPARSLPLAALLLVGCPAGSVPVEMLPARLAPSYCAFLDRCDAPFVLGAFGGADCVGYVEDLVEDSLVLRAQAAITAGTVRYRGDLVDGCLGALDAAPCNANALGATRCTDVFEGTVPAGGDCSWDEECVDGYCSNTDGVCPGTCGRRIAEGGACMVGDACDLGLTCQSGMCRPTAGAGSPCEGSCPDINLTCVMGTCRLWSDVLVGALGEACNPSTMDFCDEGLSCTFAGIVGMAASFECTPSVAAGAACAQGFPDPGPAEQYCMMGAMPGMGTCTALPTAGQACVMMSRCGPGLRCSMAGGTATCIAPRRLGESCSSGDCLSGTCEDGVCAASGC